MPNHIKEYRKLRGLSKKYVASRLHIPVKTYTEWEEAENLSLTLGDWEELASLLGCSMGDLNSTNSPQSYLYWN